jgi:phosphoribosylformimino-5-aminoimidazole carboxamide ribotide isomerase
MQSVGVKTVICTDISKDGMMSGTNLKLYAELQKRFGMNFIASGGVSSLDDVRQLTRMNIYGAIIGKALYTGAIRLEDALDIAKEAE